MEKILSKNLQIGDMFVYDNALYYKAHETACYRLFYRSEDYEKDIIELSALPHDVLYIGSMSDLEHNILKMVEQLKEQSL